MRIKDLAAFLNLEWEGDGDHDVRHVAPLDAAGPDDLSFVSSAKTAKSAGESAAGCLIVPTAFPNPQGRTILRAANPRATVARAIAKLYPKSEPPAGVHPSAVIGPGAVIGHGTYIGPHVTIGGGVHIGAHCNVGAGCAIGDYVHIGDHSVLHPHVTIYPESIIGRETILHSGCVIGADGFGFVLTGDTYENFPQIGHVEIGDRVEIGANSCVDRAALGVTRIGDGTKLDNMVHIGHNCTIGKHVVIAAQTGISGGVVVDDYAVIGGQVGIGDKAHIESRAILGSGSGVLTSKIVRGGQVYWGTPARPLKEHLEQLAVLNRMRKARGKSGNEA